MTREELEAKLVDYAMGEVTPAERAELEAALAADERLRAKLAELRETIGLVAACAPETKGEHLAPERVDAILSRIVTAPRAERRGWFGPAMLAAGVAAAIGLSILGNSLARRDMDRLQASMDAQRLAAQRSEKTYEKALTELVGRASELRTRQEELQKALVLADHELTRAESKCLAIQSDYTLLVLEQQKLQTSNGELDLRIKNLNASLGDEKKLREDAQRTRDTVQAELLASSDRLEKAYKDISELEKSKVETARANNDIEQQLTYLNEHVPGYDRAVLDKMRHDAAMEEAVRRESTVVGEAGLFTREHFGGPSEFYDLRSRSVYPAGSAFKQFVAGLKGRQGSGKGTIGRLLNDPPDDVTAWGVVDTLPDPRNREQYNPLVDNPFLRPFDAPLSTFSIDVDTASYANVRRFLGTGQLPPPDAVRLEEMVNYFHYNYAQPADGKPFSVALEARNAPWEPKHQLVRIGLQGKEVDIREAPASNLVLLLDCSGSMAEANKLELVKPALKLLVEQMREKDKLSIVTYSDTIGTPLPPTSGAAKATILEAIDKLSGAGGTNGGEGIQTAYKVAKEAFIKDGSNRVMLCTDGDFNIGITDEGALKRLIEDERKSGVFLTCLGVGGGNYSDARMQTLAQCGNGNAYYLDSLKEAQKVLVEQATGTLLTIAKDVKIQVEFNPAKVAAYRLVGYESRLLAAQDFNDDKKDAGEIGAGHQVTAMYEVIPTGLPVPAADVDALKYQTPAAATAKGDAANELCTVKLRFKKPDGDVSEKIEFSLPDPGLKATGTEEFDFAASVAAFAMCLRGSEYRGQASFALALELARGGLGDDAKGYRKELVELIKKAKELAKEVDPRAALIDEVRKSVYAPVAGTSPGVNVTKEDIEKAVDEFLKAHGQAMPPKEQVDAIAKDLIQKALDAQKK